MCRGSASYRLYIFDGMACNLVDFSFNQLNISISSSGGGGTSACI